MTADEFNEWAALLGPSRRKLCEKLGIAKRSGDAYGTGKADVPMTVALAIAALEAGLSPAGSPKKNAEADAS